MEIPEQCHVTLAQVLSRHGARDPTSYMAKVYRDLIEKIHTRTTTYSAQYQFLRDYTFDLGADELTSFGEQQLVNSGIKFYRRYQDLTRRYSLFVRAGGQHRVVVSAEKFTEGFHDALLQDDAATIKDPFPYPILAIPEGDTFNNTLSMETCPNFNTESEYRAKKTWQDIFATSITQRVNGNLEGANLTAREVINLMGICPFETVASRVGAVAQICSLFDEDEWKGYDYYHTLGKYYGFSWGNKLAATQGIGYVNELIARLTNTPVNDHTTTNSTLDTNPKTFPLGEKAALFADFSHDNDMSMIFAAMGLFNETSPPPTDHLLTWQAMKGFSAANTVPFAARMYVEKLSCTSQDAEGEEDWVRVIVNDRVMPLSSCGGDSLGRCRLDAFVESLSFARSGGDWDKCFI